ncbi:MAG: glycyl-radical enzyme activating protein, partial [Candidatus Geothermincolia bacterium]
MRSSNGPLTDSELFLSVQHFCLQDGPGVRSLVFFKGCPLRCGWCQNPESWSNRPQLAFKDHLCIGCGRCVEACPGSLRRTPGLPPADCRLCFACSEACPAGALHRFGEPARPAAIFQALEPEFPLFKRSGGGVTFSGGEPLLCSEAATELATRLRAAAIPVALETCGLFSLPRASSLLALAELVLFDIKLFDDGAHRHWCGGSNQVIKENLAALASNESVSVWPRL